MYVRSFDNSYVYLDIFLLFFMSSLQDNHLNTTIRIRQCTLYID